MAASREELHIGESAESCLFLSSTLFVRERLAGQHGHQKFQGREGKRG